MGEWQAGSLKSHSALLLQSSFFKFSKPLVRAINFISCCQFFRRFQSSAGVNSDTFCQQLIVEGSEPWSSLIHNYSSHSSSFASFGSKKHHYFTHHYKRGSNCQIMTCLLIVPCTKSKNKQPKTFKHRQSKCDGKLFFCTA